MMSPGVRGKGGMSAMPVSSAERFLLLRRSPRSSGQPLAAAARCRAALAVAGRSASGRTLNADPCRLYAIREVRTGPYTIIRVCSWPSSVLTRTSPVASATSVPPLFPRGPQPQVRLGEDPHDLEPPGERPRFELVML